MHLAFNGITAHLAKNGWQRGNTF